MTHGKGKRVTAGCLLTHDVLRIYLHVTADQLFRIWQTTVMGHLQAGAIGYNAHAANGLTAIFIATGQDVANVVNSACAMTCFEPHPEGLYVSTTLPSLSVATVGGGTALPTPREALGIMGCVGKGKARKFAEIVCRRRFWEARSPWARRSPRMNLWRRTSIMGGTARNEELEAMRIWKQ